MATKNDFEEIKLKDLIVHATDETRIILPGTQTLLGFQFATFFANGFKDLTEIQKYIHLGSLGCVTLSIAVLMSVAAYHRITEKGQDSLSLHKYISNTIMLGLFLLALGLSGDIIVVVSVVTKVLNIGIYTGVAALVLFIFLWYGFPFLRRKTLK